MLVGASGVQPSANGCGAPSYVASIASVYRFHHRSKSTPPRLAGATVLSSASSIVSASASATAPAAPIIQDPALGPDSYTGYLVSTFQGSTETTFYVLAVYYGAVQVRRIRHTLTADVAGIAGAVIACSYLYGGR